MVDFTGAIFIKTSKFRNARVVKAYICIFVCMSTKALHVELVSDMSADAFIAALRRFIARRGEVKVIFSDNGTNFVAANRLLNELSNNENEEFNTRISNELSTQRITWKFSPPGAPHFNGLVEAGVKTVKMHLMKVMGEQKFTFEELTTILAQIESAVNSRPLTPISCDVNDIQVLTPAHFLINSHPTAIASENLDECKISYLDRWKRVQQTSSPVGQWPMGRVIKVHPGQDGLIRVATIKTSHNTLTRPLTKLAPLPIDDANEIPNSLTIENDLKKSTNRTQNMGTSSITALLTTAMTITPVNATTSAKSIETTTTTIIGVCMCLTFIACVLIFSKQIRKLATSAMLIFVMAISMYCPAANAAPLPSSGFWIAGQYVDKLEAEDRQMQERITKLTNDTITSIEGIDDSVSE
ncbi:uncharacterized protein LOC129572809, partial [Sitodiplosis mosellana]|uniref:uncharacterized protein LOC129572809 n=1 Tax=Sitodiplosis mosellana TaxID=263140 RepID=UPI00244427F9